MHSPAMTGSPRTRGPQFRPSPSSWTHPSGSPRRIVIACLLASALSLSLHAQQWIEVNHALAGSASQSSTIFDGNNPDAGNAALAIDGNVNGVFNAASGSVTHSGGAAADADAGGPFWEVDLAATNDKLVDRAVRVMREIAPELSREQAFALLRDAGGHVKVALVMHARGVGASDARALIDACGGSLRAAMAR